MSYGRRQRRDETPPLTELLARYRAYRSRLSRGELILRRVLLILMLISLAVILAAAALRSYIRPPDLPPAPVETGGTEQPGEESMGDEPPVAAGRKDGVYTFLVCGRDTSSGNTDTIILVTFDTENGTIDGMSLPRDTMVNVSWTTKKINTLFKMLGPDGLKEHVGLLTGVTPDYYVLVEWEAVGELVDAIGGVVFDVPYNMDYDDPEQDLHIHQMAGERELNGDDAMQVIRWRKNNKNSPYGYHNGIGDTGRMELQQSFLMAVARECLKAENLINIPEYARIFQENVETDLTFGNLLWFGEQALDVDPESGVYFCTLPANMNGSHGGRSYVFPYPDEIVEVVNERFNPYLRDIRESDLQIMGKNADGSLYVTNGTLADPTAGRPAQQTQPDPEPSPEPEPEPSPEPEPEPSPEPSPEPEPSPAPSPEPETAPQETPAA